MSHVHPANVTIQCTWKTPGFREFHRRMQLFVLLYIEAGSYISEDEDTWEFAVLFEKRRRRSSPDVVTYHFVGYSTLYPFYCFPERVRLRISQFLILPPYQQDGHGSALYTAIYQHVLAQPHIAELTVEDPAEAFEDLRDRNDLKMLLANDKFMREGFGPEAVSTNGGKVNRKARAKGARQMRIGAGKMGPPAERAWLEKWRTDLKIAGVRSSRPLLRPLVWTGADECLRLPFGSGLCWCMVLTATVPPARRDAYPEAPRPCGRARAAVLPAAGQGAALPV